MKPRRVELRPGEANIIRAHWNGRHAKPAADIARIIRRALCATRSAVQVERFARRLKLVRDASWVEPERVDPWPEESKQFVRDHWNGPGALSDKEIGEKIGKSSHAVHKWALSDGLERDEGWARARMAVGWKHKAPEVATRQPEQPVYGAPILAGDWPADAPRFQDHPAIVERYLHRWQPVRIVGCEVRGASSLVSVTHYSRPQNRGATV